MKFNSIINNFSSGLWSPKMIARADTEEYFKSCTDVQNMISQIQGGMFRRPGSVNQNFVTGGYLAKLQTGAYVRAIPYRTTSGTRYALFFTTGVAGAAGQEWFWVNLDTLTCGNINAALNSAVAMANIATAHYVQVGDLLYIAIDGTFPRVVYTPFSGVINMVEFYQVKNALNFGGIDNRYQQVPYQPIQSDNSSGTLTVTGTFTVGGFVTVVSSATRFLSGDDSSGGNRPGLIIKISKGGVTGVMEVTGYTNSTTVTAQVAIALPGASGDAYGVASGTSFEIGAWSQARGWPRTIAAYEQRIYWGGTITYPDTIWGTRIGTTTDLMEIPLQQDPTFSTFTSDNTRPWSATLAVAPECYAIQSMSSSKTLEIHSVRQDIVAYGGNGQPLGPLNKVFESSTSFGGAYVQPVRVNNYSTFAQRAGTKIRDVVYSFNEDQYKSSDLGFMADSLFYGTTVKRMVSLEFGQTSLLVVLKNNGKIISCAIDRDYKINAWNEWTFTSKNGITIQDIFVIPQAGPNGEDALYLLMLRVVSGSNVVSLEKVYTFFDGTTYDFYGSGDQMYYLDSLEQAVNSTPGVANLTHTAARLAGETVSVIADGYYVGEKVLDGSGNVTLETAAIKVMVGLKYRSYIKTSPIQAGAQFGTPVNQIKAARRLIINFYKTLAASFRTAETDTLDEISFRDPAVAGNVLTPVFTGSKVVDLSSLTTRQLQFEFETSTPFPMNISSIVVEGVTYD